MTGFSAQGDPTRLEYLQRRISNHPLNTSTRKRLCQEPKQSISASHRKRPSSEYKRLVDSVFMPGQGMLSASTKRLKISSQSNNLQFKKYMH